MFGIVCNSKKCATSEQSKYLYRTFYLGKDTLVHKDR